jgi:hypothetical protein
MKAAVDKMVLLLMAKTIMTHSKEKINLFRGVLIK